MTVKERVKAVRLAERIARHREYAKGVGVVLKNPIDTCFGKKSIEGGERR